jgi:hypothetical protein
VAHEVIPDDVTDSIEHLHNFKLLAAPSLRSMPLVQGPVLNLDDNQCNLQNFSNNDCKIFKISVILIVRVSIHVIIKFSVSI